MALVVFDGRRVVEKAGNRVALELAESLCKSVTVMAEDGNTGVIVVGADTVVAALATRRGVRLLAGQSQEFIVPQIAGMPLDLDLADVYIDSSVDGDGVHFGGVRV